MRVFCPDTARAPALNAKQLLGRQSESTKGSRTWQQSSQPPPMAPRTVPSFPESHNRELNMQEKYLQGFSVRGFWAVASPLRRSLFHGGHGGICCSGRIYWSIILGGFSMALFCRRQLLLLGPAAAGGQQAEKCGGPIPAVSPAAAPSASFVFEPAHSKASLRLMLQESGGGWCRAINLLCTSHHQTPAASALSPHVGMAQQHLTCPQTATPSQGVLQSRGLGPAQSQP